MLQIIEGPAYNESMGSNDFRTINNCLWNVLVTMTTVGYGDTYPITNLGRIVNIISSIGGIVATSLPEIIIAESSTPFESLIESTTIPGDTFEIILMLLKY